MITQKVQLSEEDLQFVEEACRKLKYRSKSEYFRDAIKERIRNDRSRLRELKRQAAMEAYGDDFDHAFESIEGEDFEDR